MKLSKFIAIATSFSVLVLLSSCGTPEEKVPDKAGEIERYTSTIRGEKEVVDAVHGKEVNFMYGAVSGVAGTNANGVAFVRTYEDGTSVVTVNLNILLAPQGQHYQAYLSGGPDNPIDLGMLRSIVGDVRHNAELETKDSLGARTTVVIKLGNDTIAEGEVKVPDAPIN